MSSVPEIDVDAPESEEPNDTGTPERNLLLAILERAILDFVGNDKREMDRAGEWLFHGMNAETPATEFSFRWICEILELDPLNTVEKIRQMPKRGANRIAPWYFAKKEFCMNEARQAA